MKCLDFATNFVSHLAKKEPEIIVLQIVLQLPNETLDPDHDEEDE